MYKRKEMGSSSPRSDFTSSPSVGVEFSGAELTVGEEKSEPTLEVPWVIWLYVVTMLRLGTGTCAYVMAKPRKV